MLSALVTVIKYLSSVVVLFNTSLCCFAGMNFETLINLVRLEIGNTVISVGNDTDCLAYWAVPWSLKLVEEMVELIIVVLLLLGLSFYYYKLKLADKWYWFLLHMPLFVFSDVLNSNLVKNYIKLMRKSRLLVAVLFLTLITVMFSHLSILL